LRSRRNARTTKILICTARELFRTLAAIVAPWSVNASGVYLIFAPRFKITDCDLERWIRIASARVSRNTKSGGKRRAFRLTALVQRSRLYSINLREVAGKDHALPSHQHGQPFDDGYNLAGRRHEILLPPTDTRAIDVRSHAMSLRRAGQ